MSVYQRIKEKGCWRPDDLKDATRNDFIRMMYKDGPWGCLDGPALAKEFNLSKTMIYKILRGDAK